MRDIDSPKKGSCWWGRRLCKGWYIRGIKYTNTNLHTWTNPSPQASRPVHAVSAPYQYTADSAAGSGTGFQGNGSSSRPPQSVSSRFSAEVSHLSGLCFLSIFVSSVVLNKSVLWCDVCVVDSKFVEFSVSIHLSLYAQRFIKNYIVHSLRVLRYYCTGTIR